MAEAKETLPVDAVETLPVAGCETRNECWNRLREEDKISVNSPPPGIHAPKAGAMTGHSTVPPVDSNCSQLQDQLKPQRQPDADFVEVDTSGVLTIKVRKGTIVQLRCETSCAWSEIVVSETQKAQKADPPKRQQLGTLRSKRLYALHHADFVEVDTSGASTIRVRKGTIVQLWSKTSCAWYEIVAGIDGRDEVGIYP